MENKTTIDDTVPKLWQAIHHKVFQYISSFQDEDANVQLNFVLKKEHIVRVVQYAEMLAESIGCDENFMDSARLAALLHGVGRFEQFQQYHTFNDDQSENHAAIALRVIAENHWLEGIPNDMSMSVLKAVEYHNKLSVPKNETPEVIFLSNLLRDADKLDILDQAVKEFSLQNKFRNNAFSYDLKQSPVVSKAIAKSFAAEKLPSKSDMKTVTDFKLIQMAFVYDMHFKLSFSLINKKGILKQLFDTMPKSDQVFDLYRKARIHVENQLI